MTFSTPQNVVKRTLHEPPIIAHMSTIVMHHTVWHRSYNSDKPEVCLFYQFGNWFTISESTRSLACKQVML